MELKTLFCCGRKCSTIFKNQTFQPTIMKMFNWLVSILHVAVFLHAFSCVDVGLNIYTYRVHTRFMCLQQKAIQSKLCCIQWSQVKSPKC